jgi:ergothioneine biosynthesis protein EgtB
MLYPSRDRLGPDPPAVQPEEIWKPQRGHLRRGFVALETRHCEQVGTSRAANPGRDTTRGRLIGEYRRVRALTESLAEPLTAEDQTVQSMPDCSPTRWHRAHTTWFFDTFLLEPHGGGAVRPEWGHQFNSYYEAVGPRHPRPQRGVLSRPGVAEITRYRRAVDERVEELIPQLSDSELGTLRPLIELGLAHEQQHQELILTDIHHALSQNSLLPGYRPLELPRERCAASPIRFHESPGGLVEIGARPDSGFFFDNEGPRHKAWLDPFSIASRLVTVGEWKAFSEAGGYGDPALWLSAGLDWVRANEIDAPLYARREGGALVVFGLEGEREADDAEPVTHLSYYEADALARFLGGRLPTEAEWEVVAANAEPRGNFLEDGSLRALAAPAAHEGAVPAQLFGDAWEWTQSSYGAYPGYRPAAGALGEYNGKFMANQFVLRGGSSLTPRGHVRASYRNFWPPETRFQMTGLRLAQSLPA